MRSHKTESFRINENHLRAHRALVIERAGRRQVYPADDPFGYRQPPRELVPLKYVLVDVFSVLAYEWSQDLARGDEI